MTDAGGEADKQEPEPTSPLVQSSGAAGAPGEKPRKVAKTLLFNTPTGEKTSDQIKLEEAVKQAAEQDLDEKELTAHAQKRAARRVAKTLLFSSTNIDDLQAKAAAHVAAQEAAQAAAEAAAQVSEATAPVEVSPVVNVETVAAAVRPIKKTRKIAKTLMESDLDNFAEENLSQPVEPQIDFSISAPATEASVAETAQVAEAAPVDVLNGKVVKRERQQFVAKTMLDHSILWDTVSKFEAKMEVKVAEQIAERASEPVKMLVPIECKKQAMACGFKWDDSDTKERFRYCTLCKTPVYNFAGLEMPEAEELIFQRENKKQFTLFKRPDGKFMTANCPVEVKRQRDTIFLAVGAVLLVLCALAFMILMPKPPKPDPQVQAVETPAQPGVMTGPGENRGTNSSSKHATMPATADDGSFHMVNGQRVLPPTGSAPVNFPPPQQPAVTSDADESGDFWQYDGPPSGRSDAPPPVMTQPVAPVSPQTQPQAQQQDPSFAPQHMQQQYPQPVTDRVVPKPTSGTQVQPTGGDTPVSSP